ncbi:MAG: O-antigen ligase family protein [Phycisphaerae bacterium]|nr:O-antigen ligase family protein [Phycisphaerae bacterium]
MTDSRRQPPPPAASHAYSRVAESVLFAVLLVLLCVRPLISEEFERADLGFLAALGAQEAGPTPATTTWLDAALLVFSMIALGLRLRLRQIRIWYGVGTVLLAIAVVLSCVAAGEKRIAINAGADLLITVLAGGALLGVMRAPWMWRLLLAALLATAAATSVKCIVQKHADQQLTEKAWEQRKAESLESGDTEQDPTLVNFERRVKSGEVMGFLSHSNVTAAHLGAWALIVAGLTLTALRTSLKTHDASSRGVAGVGMLLLAPLCYALYLTGSTGALVAVAGGVVALVVLGLAARWVSGRPRTWAALLLAGYVSVIGAGAAYGIAKGTLPHTSLAFRWYYWSAAGQGYAEAGAARLTGIGRENFRDMYQRYRPPLSTEEVRNPHDLWVTALVELGPLGLAALAILTAGLVTNTLRAVRGPGGERALPARSSPAYVAIVAAGVLLTQLVASQTITAGSGQSERSAVLLLWLIEFAAVWAIVFVMAARACFDARLDGSWLGAGLVAALLATLVHNLVGFSLLTPAGLSTFVLIAVCAVALRRNVANGNGVTGARVAVTAAVTIAVGGAYVGLVAIPTTRANALLDSMISRLYAAQSLADVASAVRQGMGACAVDPFDASVPRRVARQLAGIATADAGNGEERRDWLAGADTLDIEQRRSWLARAESAGLTSLARNPASSGTYRVLAKIHDALATTWQRQQGADEMRGELDLAVGRWRRAVELFPTDPRLRIDAAATMIRAWHASGEALLAREAERHLHDALAIDATRPVENTSRLSAEELAFVNELLGEVGENGESSGAAQDH